jgi:hypothetical protein
MVFNGSETIHFYIIIIELLPHDSSVSVPVLSNTIILTLPALFTADGAIQNIPFFLSLPIANKVPVMKAVVRVDGTKVVIRFNKLSISSQVSQYFTKLGKHVNQSTVEIEKQANKKYFASCSNLYLFAFGNKKFFINVPLAVS